MKSYEDCLNIVKAHNIIYDRGYTIDNLLYIHFTTIREVDVIRLKRLFVEVDLYNSYLSVCIDMEKQPGMSTDKSNELKSIVMNKKKRIEQIDSFNLDEAAKTVKDAIENDIEHLIGNDYEDPKKFPIHKVDYPI